MAKMTAEVRVAPNIWRTAYGFRVYVRGIDETTGKSKLKPFRFGPEKALDELEHFRDSFKLEVKQLRIERRKNGVPAAPRIPAKQLFPADADTYLDLKSVRAMESFSDREREIAHWKKVFRKHTRKSITARLINEQLQALVNAGYSNSTVNKFRAALMSLFTQLDGRSAANPVKETRVFEEAEEIPRGQDPQLLRDILDTIPVNKPRKPGAPAAPNLSRVCIEMMIATGYAPAHIARLELDHFSIAEEWYVVPRRKKGKVVRRPPPIVRLRMTADARQAFTRLVDVAGDQLTKRTWKGVDRKDLSHTWQRACRRYERQQREHDSKFKLPRIRLYDIRHSFGTELYEETENLGTVAMFLGNTPRTARRYSTGAVPVIVEKAAAALEQRAQRRRAGNRKRR